MSEKQIFNNYKDKCPMCDGDLDSEHKFCPYCGVDLQQVNLQYRDNESIITEAIEDIDEAKKQLAYHEQIYKESKKKKGNWFTKILKWGAILFCVNIALLFIIGLVLTFVEDAQDKKIEEFKQTLLSQSVDVEEYDEIDLDDYEFVNTKKQSSAGYIQEADGVIAIPFYSDSYSSEGIFKGTIYIDSEDFDDYGNIYENRASLYYEDFYLTIDAEESYYESSTDALIIWETSLIDKTKRLDDVQIRDMLFECYQRDDEFVMITNPFAGCFIVIEGSPVYDNDNFDFDDMMKILKIDCDLEIK